MEYQSEINTSNTQAGQERFSQMHPSYYYKAHACIMVFGCSRKITYTHLSSWLKELREYCKNIPVICICNKIDMNEKVTKKKFKFPQKHNMPFFFVSAATGTNVVRVFKEAIKLGWEYKTKSGDWMSDVMALLDDSHIDDDDDEFRRKISTSSSSTSEKEKSK